MEYQVGKYYKIPHAKMVNRLGEVNHVPVIGPAHSDPQFLINERHLHIDGRFVGRGLGWLSREVFDSDGKTNHIMRFGDYENHWGTIVDIVERRAKCYRTETGLDVPTKPDRYTKERVERYWKWYNGYVGKSCLGKKCPHLGQEMLDLGGGLWRCPLHNLHGDANTGKIVQPPKNCQI